MKRRRIAYVRKFRCGQESPEMEYEQDSLTPDQRVQLVIELTKLAFNLDAENPVSRLPRHLWPVKKFYIGKRNKRKR